MVQAFCSELTLKCPINYFLKKMINLLSLLNILVKIKAKPNGRGAQFGDRVVPACLPHMNVVYGPHLNCSVYGWGSMNSNDPKFARYLQSTKMPYLDTEQCIKPQVYGPKKLSSGMFCAGYLEGGKFFFRSFQKNYELEIKKSENITR